MERREAIQKIGIFAGGAVITPAILAPACNGPKLDAEIQIAQIGLNTLSIIVPGVAPLASKISKLLVDVDADAKAGKFDSAQAALDNLETFIAQLQDDAGIGLSDRAKLILVSVLGAVRAIAVLVKAQMTTSAKATLRASTVKALDVMTSPQSINAMLTAAKIKF